MKNKITLLFCLGAALVATTYGQTKVNDFESGSPTTNANFGATFSIVSNPNSTGNTSASVAKIGRTTTNWYEGISFDLTNPYTIPAGETKYFHVLVNFTAQPDIGARFDIANASSFGGSTTIRPTITYTNIGQWQDVVFTLEGGESGLTVNAILFHADIGAENDPQGQILNNTDNFGYVDELTFSDSDEVTLSNSKNEFGQSITIFPNPTTDVFKVNNSQNTTITDVVIYDTLGKDITNTVVMVNKNYYYVGGLKSGMYMVLVKSNKGGLTVKKLIVN